MDVLESSWTIMKLYNNELVITLNIQESRLNNVIEPNNVYICSILNKRVVKSTHCYLAMFVSKNVLHQYRKSILFKVGMK